MRILHIIPSLETGGAQTLIARMLPLMNSCKGVSACVAVGRLTNSDNERRLREKGVEIINLGVSLRSLSCLPSLRRIMKRADVVHVHLFPALYLAAIASRGLGKPIFFTEHNTHNRRRDLKWLKPIERVIYRTYTGLITISEASRKSLADWIGIDRSDTRLKMIHNGINLREWSQTGGGSALQLFGRQGVPLFMAARFSRAKDHATVVKALSLIEQEDIFVVFAGDGPTRWQVETLARELGVIDRVIFMGDRSDVPELASVAAVGIISSHWEGFGLVAVEMMAAGLPLVVSNVEGLADVAGDAALHFEAGNPVELAHCVETILENPELRQSLVERGRKRSACFAIETTVDDHLRLYRESLRRMSDS